MTRTVTPSCWPAPTAKIRCRGSCGEVRRALRLGAPGGLRGHGHGRADGVDAGEDEIDPGEELLAVVVLGQLRCDLTHERVLAGVELRPLCGDGREECRSVGVGVEEASTGGVLRGEAEDVVHERGRGVELRPFGNAERLEMAADALEDLQDRGLPWLAGELGTHPRVGVDRVEHPEGDVADRSAAPRQSPRRS